MKPQKSLKQLKIEWYKKLKASGFVDQEDQYERLNSYSHMRPTDEAKELYYRQAGFFLYGYDFLSIVDRRVWGLHCAGWGRNTICKMLIQAGSSTTPAKVRYILERLGREFKLYRYLNESNSETD